MVVAIDFTQSVAVPGPDGTTEFQKNVEGVTRLLAEVPSGTHLTVIGITDRTFSQPYILLRAAVPDDPGYFGERLRAARAELMQAWKKRSAEVKAGYHATDIFGALSLAEQIFENDPTPGRKVLVIFSDMRHHTSGLDLESSRAVPSIAAVRSGAATIRETRLEHVEIYVLGVDGAGKTTQYWDGLRALWTEYLASCGATLRSYSVLREAPVFAK